MFNDIRDSLYVMILPYKDESKALKNNILKKKTIIFWKLMTWEILSIWKRKEECNIVSTA